MAPASSPAAPPPSSAESTSAGGPKLRVAKSVYYRHMRRMFTSWAIWTLVALFGVYCAFAVTIVRVVPTSTSLGPEPVKNSTFLGGIVPLGAVILADSQDPQGSGLLDRAHQALIPSSHAMKVKVLAGPYGRVSWTPSGFTTVAGKPLGVLLKQDPQVTHLNGQYVAQCLGGSCNPGEGVIIKATHIYGQSLVDGKGVN